MRFTIHKSELSKYIGIAQRAISNKSAIQILDGIVFEAGDDELILSSTDLEISINTRVACNVQEKGILVLNSEVIGNIVRKMPNDLITFSGDIEGIKVVCQNTTFDLKGQDAIDYPSLPDPVNEITFSMDAKDLREAIRETIFSTSLDEKMLALTGILFSQTEDAIKFVGLDGHRMSVKTYRYENSDFTDTIVPKRSLSELSKIIEEGVVDISIVKGHVIFTNENTTMYSRTIDKKYIDYKKIVNNQHTTKLMANRDDLVNSLERASLLVGGNGLSLSKFQISDGVINLHSISDYGQLNEDVNCQKIGEDLTITFNNRYVLEGLKAISDDQVIIYFNSSLNPMIIHPKNDEEGFLYLVLPIRMAN